MKRHLALLLLLVVIVPGNSAFAEDRSKYETNYAHEWIDGSEPDMPAFVIVDESRNYYAPQKSDKRKRIYINENFVVPKGKTKTFYNKIVWMRPKSDAKKNIEVYGRLRFINCLILWEQTSSRHVQLVVKRGGSLYGKNTYAMKRTPHFAYWNYEDGSKVDFDRFRSNIMTSIYGSVRYTSRNFSTAWLSLFDDVNNSRVVVLNAHHTYFEIFPPEGKISLTLPRGRKWQSFTLNNIWPKTKVIVRNSYTHRNDVSLKNNVHVTVKNAVDGFGLGWTVDTVADQDGPFTCTLKGLGNPKYGIDLENSEHPGTYYKRKTWRLPCNNSSLTAINSTLFRAYPNMYDPRGTFKIYSSSLEDIIFGSGKMEIYNSRLSWAQPFGKGTKLYLHNVKVRHWGWITATDSSRVYGYKVRSVKAGKKVPIVETDGGRYIKLTSPGPPW